MTKNLPQDVAPESVRDLARLTEPVKAWGKELGFQEIGITDATFDVPIRNRAATMVGGRVSRRDGLYGETRGPAHPAGRARSRHA
jgi:hypothetical protein